MKNIDKKQLKIISLEFRTISNRLINCNYQTGMSLLKKFLLYIDENEIIYDYIQEYVKEEDFEPVEKGTVFTSMGDTKQEEISYTYQFLKYAVDNFQDFYRHIAWGYANGTDASIKEFCYRIILPFVNYIEGYLTEIGIKMGYDEEVKYMVTVNGGIAQVNVANDNAKIEATQTNNNNMEKTQLEEIISRVMAALPQDISDEEQQQVSDSIEVIRAEVESTNPRRSFINTALNGLKMINGTAQFGAALATLVEFTSQIVR